MKLLVINGPNINMLGVREPAIYGTMTYVQLVKEIESKAAELGISVECYQSNHEGSIVDAIQGAYQQMDGIIINPAAYTHTSVAILDALKAVGLPAAEVHISDIATREDFRHISYTGKACQWHFIGQGIDGYFHAMETIKGFLDYKN